MLRSVELFPTRGYPDHMDSRYDREEGNLQSYYNQLLRRRIVVWCCMNRIEVRDLMRDCAWEWGKDEESEGQKERQG